MFFVFNALLIVQAFVGFGSVHGDPTFFASPRHAIETFVEAESDLNLLLDTKPAIRFDTRPFDVRHIEFQINHPALYRIPRFTDWFSKESIALGPNAFIWDEAKDLDPLIRNAFLFRRGSGEGAPEFIRWPQFPGDEFFGSRLKAFLSSIGVPYTEESYFRGYFTSSRSLILRDPVSGKFFSYKTSTDRTTQGFGGFQFRPVPTRWSYLTRRMNDFLFSRRDRFLQLDLAWEPLSFGFPPLKLSSGLLDTGAQIRLIDEMSENRAYHVSGFVLERKEFWDFIAMRSKGPVFETKRKIFTSMLNAILEMNLLLGITFRSTHGQNIRFEFDKNWEFTGKVIILDFQDSLPIADHWIAAGQTQLLEDWVRFVGDSNPPISMSESALNVVLGFYRKWNLEVPKLDVDSSLYQHGFIRNFVESELQPDSSGFYRAELRSHAEAITGSSVPAGTIGLYSEASAPGLPLGSPVAKRITSLTYPATFLSQQVWSGVCGGIASGSIPNPSF